MRVFKVSFLMRSPSVNWEYKAANNRDLADDLTAALEKAVAPAKPVRLSKGSIQHHFYIETDSTAEQHREAAAKLLEALIPDEKLRKMIIISVTEPGQEEVEKLRRLQELEAIASGGEAAAAQAAVAKADANEQTTVNEQAAANGQAAEAQAAEATGEAGPGLRACR